MTGHGRPRLGAVIFACQSSQRAVMAPAVSVAATLGEPLHLVGQLLELGGVGTDAVDVGTLRQEPGHVTRAPREIATVPGLLQELIFVRHGSDRFRPYNVAVVERLL